MADITTQQLKDYLDKRLDVFATKEDLDNWAKRLERKIDSNQEVNIAHHLAIRAEIGELNRKFDKLREGLSHAAEAA